MEAQMILSCVARTGQQYPEEVIVQLMRGVLPYPPPEGIYPAELTTFGLMNDVEEATVRDITGALVAQGYLERDEKNCLKLSRQSKEVLYGKHRVAMKRRTGNRKEIGGEDLFQALQRLRYEISAREYVAASALFSDAVLRDFCRTLPRTKKQLAAVDGMGIFKANRYGDLILQVIRRYAPEPESGKASGESTSAARTGNFQAYKDKVIAKGNTEAYQSWSAEEDRQLIREHEDGKTVRELSEIHKRTPGAIQSRLKKLGRS
jgi:ATP-dependent DNA helicase RecQ